MSACRHCPRVTNVCALLMSVCAHSVSDTPHAVNRVHRRRNRYFAFILTIVVGFANFRCKGTKNKSITQFFSKIQRNNNVVFSKRKRKMHFLSHSYRGSIETT